jgi:hypothetical protein
MLQDSVVLVDEEQEKEEEEEGGGGVGDTDERGNYIFHQDTICRFSSGQRV